MKNALFIFLTSVLYACNPQADTKEAEMPDTTTIAGLIESPSPPPKQDTAFYGSQEVSTGDVYADSVVIFAESLKGIPYKYASTDPDVGFDCSGFITYVFTHFNISVPRSSKDFENVGTPVMLLGAQRGDLILFTGTDSTDSTIGHMGIITSNNNGDIHFIHSTSGKANGVTESLVNDSYLKRYVKTVRVFNR